MRVRAALIGAFIATSLMLALSGGAHAGTLTTGMLYNTFWNDVQAGAHLCFAINAGQKTVKNITIDMIGGSGAVAFSNECTNVAPNGRCGNATTGEQVAFCRITFTGPKTDIRGTLTVFDGNDIPHVTTDAR
jgi:hypothetical protein